MDGGGGGGGETGRQGGFLGSGLAHRGHGAPGLQLLAGGR